MRQVNEIKLKPGQVVFLEDGRKARIEEGDVLVEAILQENIIVDLDRSDVKSVQKIINSNPKWKRAVVWGGDSFILKGGDSLAHEILDEIEMAGIYVMGMDDTKANSF